MVVLTYTCIGAPPYRIGNLPHGTVMEAPHLRLLPKNVNFLSDDVVSGSGKDYEEAQTTEGFPSVNGYPDALKSNGLSPLDAETSSRNSATPICAQVPVVAANCQPNIGKITKNSTRAPHWGCVSICGRRQEMEDATTALLRFAQIPLQMLSSSSIEGRSGCESVHFFGVYDGHGGAQVANYCKERVHEALEEEVGDHVRSGGAGGDDMSERWHRVFTNCFQKVDAEVAAERRGDSDDGSAGRSEAIAPENVGSTAVVALVSSSHIIVANCGDSRAVLCRGKQPMPLSADHKPDREDECERIEKAGGKVIQWNGYRVMGMLAMSRSIGDRYLKPWVIAEPEVKCVSRMKEDDCLILASDGLWDVLSNAEVCDAARKSILLWHKKNGGNSLQGKGGDGPDPAAEAAADYLTKLALHKGSKDNVSVIVIDLKEQRKFKTRT